MQVRGAGLVHFIRRIYDSTHLGRIGKQGNHLFPLALPHGRDGREFAAPLALRKGVERCRLRLGRGGHVDRLDPGSQRLAVLPASQVQRISDQMHDAGLDLGGRIDRLDRFGEAAQPIDHRDQDVVQAAVLQLVEDLQPELGAFGLLDPQTQYFLAAVGADAQRQIDRLVLTVPSSRIFSRSASKIGYMASSGRCCHCSTSGRWASGPSYGLVPLRWLPLPCSVSASRWWLNSAASMRSASCFLS